MRRLPLIPALAVFLGLASGCSFRRLALSGLADTLSSGADAFAREDDPELVRYSLPVTLKAVESLLLQDPRNPTLLATAAAGFTQYAYAFVVSDARELEDVDYRSSLATQERALRLFLRARDYALAGLELRHPGIGAELRLNPDTAVNVLGLGDLDLAYWAASAWGLAISAGRDQPRLLADTDAVRALLRKALALDEDFRNGELHEAMIVIEGLPEIMGGSPERAREHFARAVALSGGARAAPYVSLAQNVALPAQNRREFETLLETALQVNLDLDPDSRLSNRLAQAEARYLLEKADDLFLE